MVKYDTVATNAGPDSVSGLGHDPVWNGEDVNAKPGEDISMGADFDPVEATDEPKKTAKKTAASKSGS